MSTMDCFSLSDDDIEEIALASEAAPLHITDDATFLKFKNDRLVTIKSGKNNFTCLVLRDPNGRFKPSCLNYQAVFSILSAYELQMKSLYNGLSNEEINAALDKAFKNGKIPKAETGALVYMMSPNNKIVYKGKLVSTPLNHCDFSLHCFQLLL